MSRSQAGFTLLEVVVAMAVVGAGFAVGLAAMSGSLRLLRASGEYEQGMLLARAAMTEALTYPDYDIADDREREVYQGVEYAYRVEFRPVGLAQSADDARTTSPPAPTVLEQISVDVFWGEGSSKTYRLVTYRTRQPASAASQTRARGNAPTTGGTAAAKDDAADGAVRSGDRPLETRRQDDRAAP
jgi:prepilin-type N-terminal cleavage/methylation domain-containing protein